MSTNDQPAVKTPEDELKGKQTEFTKKQTEFANKQTELKQAQDTINSLQTEIKALEAKITEIKQASEEYAKWYPQKNDQLKNARSLSKEMIDSAKSVIEDTIEGWIDRRIKESKENLEKTQKNMEQTGTALETAKNNLKTADAEAQQRQAEYDAIKKKSKDIDAVLQELTSLIEQANKMQAQGNYMVLYFLAREAEAVADKLEIQSPDEYTDSLKNAQAEMEKAKKKAADEKANVDKLSEDFPKAKKAYEAIIASRRADLLEEVKKGYKPNPG